MKSIIQYHKLILTCLILSTSVWADLSGDWEGTLNVNGTKLPLVIHLKTTDGKPTGTMDSPAQGSFDMPMSKVEFDDSSVMFELSNIGVHYEGTLDPKSGVVDGNFIQGGVYKLTFTSVNKNKQNISKSSDINDLIGQWGGTVEIPGNPLGFIIHISKEGNQIAASADSPDQNATGLEVDTVNLDSGTMTFTMEALGVEFTGKLSEDKQSIQGDFKQQGMVFKLNLSKGVTPTKEVAERPQEPKPPFSYQVEEVEVPNDAAHIKLAGTLTKPKNQTIKATAVMITGSGPQDRNETLFNHKPFWVIADHLTKQGFAVLRMDDRGVGESTGNFGQATSEDFVTDINAAVEFLQQRNDLPKDKIGLIGHSEGGMIAPMLASQRDDLSFLILLAGPGIPITELLAEQKFLIAKAMGQNESELKQQRVEDIAFHQNMVKWVDEGNYTEKLKPYLESVLADNTTSEKQLTSAVANNLKLYDTPWFKYFIAFDPAKYLAKTKTPILALNGELDLQVAAESNLNGIETILSTSKHPDYTIKLLPKLNHLFQTSETGSVTEYGKLTESFSPIALNAMSDWLNERF